MKMIIIIYLLAVQVNTQDITTDMMSSGDGDGLIFTTAKASLIDDNGDIQNMSVDDFVSSTVLTTLDNGTVLVLVSNDSTSVSNDSTSVSTDSTSVSTSVRLDSNITEDQSTSTAMPIDTTMGATVTNDSQLSFSTIDASTKMTTVESSTTTHVPPTTVTTTETTTTVKSTTTVEATTKSSTTTLPSKVTAKVEAEQSSMKMSRMPTVGTMDIPTNTDELCTFEDSSFICETYPVCYRGGEIDCTEEIGVSPAETIFIDKISHSSTSEDYPEYEGAGDGVETFPPHLIGVQPEKKKFPFSFFKIGSLGTTASDINDSETVQDSEIIPLTTVTSIEVPFVLFVEKLHTEGSEEELDPDPRSTSLSSTVLYGDDSSTSEISSTSELSSTSYVSSTSEFSSSSEVSSISEEEGIASTEESSTVETMVQDATTAAFSSAETKDSLVANIRRKRDETASRYESKSFIMPPSNKTRRCVLRGNVTCKPHPVTVNCRGRTRCIIKSTAETSEQPTSTKGLDNLTIAVIVICATIVTSVVSCMMYCIFTSWKKKKVQPQNVVTTLTFINSAASIP